MEKCCLVAKQVTKFVITGGFGGLEVFWKWTNDHIIKIGWAQQASTSPETVKPSEIHTGIERERKKKEKRDRESVDCYLGIEPVAYVSFFGSSLSSYFFLGWVGGDNVM